MKWEIEYTESEIKEIDIQKILTLINGQLENY